jgi:histidinol-phosphate phosphatase family protein
MRSDFDVVVPTIGRPTLGDLLESLALQPPPHPGRVLLVDDRHRPSRPLITHQLPAALVGRFAVLAGPGRGPAAARNVGWRASQARWVAFLDDDVLPDPDWTVALAVDLTRSDLAVAGVQGRIRVPQPDDRAPTDWERHVAGLQNAQFATADMAFRREALVAAGGFDERFRRAYREDADLALRLRRAGWKIERGRRAVVHPVRPAGPFVSVRLQAGNADDVLMRVLHGRDWRRDAGAPPGRWRRHRAIAAAGAGALALTAIGRSRSARIPTAAWLAGTAELAAARIRPGPRTTGEGAKMLATSAPMPFWAAMNRARGWARVARIAASGGCASLPTGPSPRALRTTGTEPNAPAPEAVLLDRDGTLIEDVPYNGDPARVCPKPGAIEALEALRAAGVRLAVVSNQSGVGRGVLTLDQVDAVNRRVEELLGPLGPWLVCVHAPQEGCQCRKPRPGLVISALERLAVSADRCALIGDIGTDVEAALAAGVRPILVPTPRTLPAEVLAAPEVASDLREAVTILFHDVA